MMNPTGVAPHVGAWIETLPGNPAEGRSPSHPTWVRGLKQHLYRHIFPLTGVAPHVGAWIETGTPLTGKSYALVAPHVGAWIETSPRGSMMGAASRTPRGCVD